MSCPAFAQSLGVARSSALAAVAGVVRDTASRLLARAVLFVDGKDLSAMSDSAGRFHVAGLSLCGVLWVLAEHRDFGQKRPAKVSRTAEHYTLLPALDAARSPPVKLAP